MKAKIDQLTKERNQLQKTLTKTQNELQTIKTYTNTNLDTGDQFQLSPEN
jgi:prefoldin subunit 5